MKILRSEAGFTLIELVLIIVILGVLAAVATIQFGTIMQDSRFSAIDGAFGQINVQLALAINSLKALPAQADAGTFETEVQDKITLSGGKIAMTDWDGTSLGIIAGGDGDTTCEAGESSAAVSYSGTTGALTLSTKSNC